MRMTMKQQIVGLGIKKNTFLSRFFFLKNNGALLTHRHKDPAIIITVIPS